MSLTSLLALPGGVLLDQGRFRALAWADLALSGTLFVAATVLLWSDEFGDVIIKGVATLAVATVACAQVSAVTSRRRESDTRGVLRLYVLSLVLVAVVAAVACAALWGEIDDENFFRVLAALIVANVFSVIVQPILRKIAPEVRDGAFRLVFTLDREPPDEAVERAREALEGAGVIVRLTERAR